MKYDIGDEVGIFYNGELTKGAIVHTFESTPGHELYIIELPTSIDSVYEVRGEMGLRDVTLCEPEPEEFEFKAHITLDGVIIVALGFTEEEARKAAEAGDWLYCDHDTGERVDWKIR